MTIDVESERVVPIQEAYKHIPGKPCLQTVYRWSLRRHNSLETFKVGARRFTTREAITRFIARSNPDVKMATPKARRKQIASAERELEAAGI